MRSPSYIASQFPDFLLEMHEKILFNPQYTDDEKSQQAMKYLGIDYNAFISIPFKPTKEDYLRYKYLRLYIELYEGRFVGEYESYRKNLKKFRKLASKAYEIVKNSDIVKQHRNQYSEFSQGLSELFHRTETYTKEGNKQPLNEPEDMGASILVTGPKKGGVEPGFEAGQYEDLFLYLDKKRFKNNETGLKQYIEDHNADLKAIYEENKVKLAKYMFKLNYEEKDGKVYLSSKDVRRTGMVQNAYKVHALYGDFLAFALEVAKSGTSNEKNKESAWEVLSNDILRSIYGKFKFIHVQEQKIFKTKHTNGELKLMAKSKWVEGSQELGKDENKNSVLFGGNKDSDNYRGRPLLIKRNGIASVTDDRIVYGASAYLTLIFSGDFDKYGSKAQNLLIVPIATDEKTGKTRYRLVIIDCGHVLREKNILIDGLLVDGRFEQPLLGRPFKNFSILSDVSFSGMMTGALLLAKAAGYTFKESTLDFYKTKDPDFYQHMKGDPIPEKKVSEKKRGDAEKVADDYPRAFQISAEQDAVKNHDQYNALITMFKKVKGISTWGLEKFYKKFSGYMHYDPRVIDLADNLKKLGASKEGVASLRSPNRLHGLMHLRITDFSYQDFWSIQLSDDGMYHLSVSLDSESKAKVLLAELQKWAKTSSNIGFDRHRGKITMNFHRVHLKEAFDIFSEDNIKDKYHHDDYEEIKKGYQEIDLNDLTKAPWFVKRNMDINLLIHPKNASQYRLIFCPTQSKKVDPVLVEIFRSSFSIAQPNMPFVYDFKDDQLQSVYDTLLLTQEKYELKHSNKVQKSRPEKSNQPLPVELKSKPKKVPQSDVQPHQESEISHADIIQKIQKMEKILLKTFSVTLSLTTQANQCTLNISGEGRKQLVTCLSSKMEGFFILENDSSHDLFFPETKMSQLISLLTSAPQQYVQEQKRKKHGEQFNLEYQGKLTEYNQVVWEIKSSIPSLQIDFLFERENMRFILEIKAQNDDFMQALEQCLETHVQTDGKYHIPYRDFDLLSLLLKKAYQDYLAKAGQPKTDLFSNQTGGPSQDENKYNPPRPTF